MPNGNEWRYTADVNKERDYVHTCGEAKDSVRTVMHHVEGSVHPDADWLPLLRVVLLVHVLLLQGEQLHLQVLYCFQGLSKPCVVGCERG